MLDFVNDMNKAIGNYMYTAGIFMDLSKAFNTINHKKMGKVELLHTRDCEAGYGPAPPPLGEKLTSLSFTFLDRSLSQLFLRFIITNMKKLDSTKER